MNIYINFGILYLNSKMLNKKFFNYFFFLNNSKIFEIVYLFFTIYQNFL